MKVALVTGSAGDGHCGVGDYAYELAQHLALDAEVHLYFGKNFGPKHEPYEKLRTLHLHPVGGFSLLSINALIKELREEGYDIVHLQYPSKGFGMAGGPLMLPRQLAGMNSRSRVVLSLHEYSTAHFLRQGAVGEMLPHIDALVLSNEQELKHFSGKLQQRPIVVLPVGNILRSRAELEAVWLRAEGQEPEPLPDPSGPQGRVPYSVFHYGLPAKGKGLERLVRAVKLAREAGKPVELYLGGEFPPGHKDSEELLSLITELELTAAVQRLGHIPREYLAETAERYMVGVFPFDEGFSSKRSSVAAISHLDLPLLVGGGSAEEHPYIAPEQNTAAALSVMLIELFSGKLEDIWSQQVKAQRDYAQRFSFSRIAAGHLRLYQELAQADLKK